MLRRFLYIFCLIMSWCGVGPCPTGQAWSELGHNLIARVSARLCMEELGTEHPLSKVLLDKELMLGHLANVPDIVWKNTDAHTAAVNYTTHFFDVDELVTPPVFATLPTTLAGLEALGGGKIKAAKFGTAPFRIQQLYGMMRDSFAQAKAAKGQKDLVEAVNQALLYGGIMAHFVGDLAQPMHTTSDHDGYQVGQGGLHGYFEGAVVSAYDLTLPGEVFQVARRRRQIAALRQMVRQRSDKSQAADLQPLLLAYALTVNSWHEIPGLESVDRTFAVLKPSSQEHGMRIPAIRRPPSQAAKGFHEIVRARLAIGAETLSELWLSAWREGGSPDLRSFQSYAYPVAPVIIETPYLNDSVELKK